MADKAVKNYLKKLKFGANEVKGIYRQTWRPALNSQDLPMFTMAQVYTYTLTEHSLRN